MGSIPVHTFVRSSTVGVFIGTNGFMPGVGLVPFLGFSIWCTPQSTFIYGNSANYITVSTPGFSDLAALFDEIMIDRVEMSIYATNLEASTAAGSANALMITDYNDKVAPATVGDVLQYQDCKAIPLLSRFPYKEVFAPKMLSYTLDSAGVSQPSTPIRGFVRSNLDVEHYCRKGYLIQTPSTTQPYAFVFRYTYKCRVTK